MSLPHSVGRWLERRRNAEVAWSRLVDIMSAVEPTEAKQWTGEDDRPDDARAHALEQEALREREWHELAALAKDFVKSHGAAAMLRCVSEALK